MIPPQYNYKLASGQNLPSGSLVNIESIRPSVKYFYPPSGYSSFNPGSVKLRTDGQVYNTGYPSAKWHFDTMWRDQYQYLQSTYCTGGNGYSGTVVVQTVNQQGTYTVYNSIMVLPTLPEMERNFISFRNVEVRFTRLQEVS